MHPKAAQLLEAHVRHILGELSGDALASTVSREANAFLDWLGERPVRSLVTAERVREIAQRHVLGKELSPDFLKQITDVAKQALDSEINRATYVHQLIEHRHYTRIIENIASRDQLRNDLIHAVVGNPTYGRLLSDVIYDALSDYMVQNPITKNVPGMSSLMKMGKGLVEGAGSSAIKGYLHKNIQTIVGRSEKTIINALDRKQIHAVAEYAWHTVKGEPLSRVRQYVKDHDVDQVGEIAAEIWEHLRKTAYIQGMVDTLIDGWFARNGERTALDLLADLNLAREDLVAEIATSAKVLVGEMAASGYLEGRLREQLTAFYGSEAVAALLG